MTLDAYFFRHAETSPNLTPGTIGGRMNSLMPTRRGLLQEIALGLRLADEGVSFDEAYASSADRTVHEAETVCRIIGFPVEKIISTPKLLELDQGEWEGRKRAEVYTEEVIARMEAEPLDFKAPNGESQREVADRVYSWVEGELLSNPASRTVGIFGHGFSIKAFLGKAFGINPSLVYRISIDNCSITRVRYAFSGNHEGWSLIGVNDTAHLRVLGSGNSSYV